MAAVSAATVIGFVIGLSALAALVDPSGNLDRRTSCEELGGTMRSGHNPDSTTSFLCIVGE